MRMLAGSLLSLAVASVGLSGPAVAAGVEGSRGKVGTHHVKRVGGTCVYASGGGLVVIVDLAVKPPVLFASSGTQTVGWRARVQAREVASGQPWKTVFALPVEKASATTTHAAALHPQHTGDGIRSSDHIGDDFRVLVDMIWYRTGGPVGGATTLVRRLSIGGGTTSPTCFWGGN